MDRKYYKILKLEVDVIKLCELEDKDPRCWSGHYTNFITSCIFQLRRLL